MHEWKVDSYISGLFETKTGSHLKLERRLWELESLGWEIVSVVGWCDWVIVARRAK